MALSTPQCLFGVHSVTAYNPDTREYLGTAKVIGSATFANAGEIIDLVGGSNLYPWKKETGLIDASGSFTFREYPDWAFEAFLGKAATTNAAETGGSVDTIANANGTTLVSSTGVASIGVKVGSEADVKSTHYVAKAVSATTVDVFAASDVDFATGTDLIFQDDLLKITASPLTIVMNATVEIPNTGLELTGGGGTIAMVTDDTATFKSRAINDGSTSAVIGSDTSTFIDVGLILHGQKQKDGTIMSIDIYRALGSGMPFNFTEKAFADVEIPWGAQYDTVRNGVFSYERVKNT